MALKDTNVMCEINEKCKQMHKKLDRLFQQLIRQVNIHFNSMIHSRKKSTFTCNGRERKITFIMI